MRYKPFRKPLLRFAKIGGKAHPVVVVGSSNGNFVGICSTHYRFVPGHSVEPMEKNLEDSYVVSDSAYVGRPSSFTKPHDFRSYSVSDHDWRRCRYLALKGRSRFVEK